MFQGLLNGKSSTGILPVAAISGSGGTSAPVLTRGFHTKGSILSQRRSDAADGELGYVEQEIAEEAETKQ